MVIDFHTHPFPEAVNNICSHKDVIDMDKDHILSLMDKLDIDYFCFHDRDIAPEAETLKETNARLDVITEEIEKLMKQYNKKLLWGTANCFGNKRYR